MPHNKARFPLTFGEAVAPQGFCPAAATVVHLSGLGEQIRVGLGKVGVLTSQQVHVLRTGTVGGVQRVSLRGGRSRVEWLEGGRRFVHQIGSGGQRGTPVVVFLPGATRPQR